MTDILNLVLPLFGLVLLGFVAGRIARLPMEGLAWLNYLVVNIMLPALIFRLVSQTPVAEFTNLAFITATTLGTFSIFFLTFGIGWLRTGGNVGESTIQGFAGAYGNIGYLGPPLALAAFGPAAAAPVALVFCFDNSMHFTLAPLLMSLRGARHPSKLMLAREILGRIFTHPFILATIIGIFAAGVEIELPIALKSLIDTLASGAAPCALFAMGVTAALRPLKRIPPELTYILPIKLLVHPLLVYWLLALIAPDTAPVWVQSAVLLAALPVATNVYVLAQQYQVWPERASSSVVISTFASIVTVTAYIYLAKNNLVAF